MRILLSARHRYPAGGAVGTGLRANPRMTGGAAVVQDQLARGLAELGQEVDYHLPKGYDLPLPPGVRPVGGAERSVDVMHHVNGQFLRDDWPGDTLAALGAPWVATWHINTTPTADLPPAPRHARSRLPANWIAVSRTLARLYDHPRFVLNGVDPADLIYSNAKEEYLLFACRADVADRKGLGLALDLARTAGFPLTVMAGSTSDAVMLDLDARCRAAGIHFVGDVRGRAKAELFAGARALLFPTQLDEGCAVVIAEALMSGTPVLASPRGSCPEMVSPDVGFLCATRDDYLLALDRLGAIRPEDCRRRALERFHYLRMARGYIAEYEHELGVYGSDSRRYVARSLDELRN